MFISYYADLCHGSLAWTQPRTMSWFLLFLCDAYDCKVYVLATKTLVKERLTEIYQVFWKANVYLIGSNIGEFSIPEDYFYFTVRRIVTLTYLKFWRCKYFSIYLVVSRIWWNTMNGWYYQHDRNWLSTCHLYQWVWKVLGLKLFHRARHFRINGITLITFSQFVSTMLHESQM